ncbi:MAG: methyltransferase [Candidatus Electryonea clarkiae]|nr:methyltransferase [Candidatus Electryonea clarkiae]MDP8286836.1 methyltransferase [Candidatus Electryonea clarkiae]
MIDWRNTCIAEDYSYHLYQGKEFYKYRFDHVLKYHPPGFAAVSRDGMAWHIDATGKAAYSSRYLRTFGFYDERAAVADQQGWTHIITDGNTLYTQRYCWCGNFQEGLCTVRDEEGNYFHIDHTGKEKYSKRWRYTGDFRDGIAVVQSIEGLSSHIVKEGSLLHGRWYQDLDVYHKGIAKAKDIDGWVHIDKSGKPLYQRRFYMIEHFYNGQARVENFNGSLEIVAEDGNTIKSLRPATKSAFSELSWDMVGFWKTETIAAAVKSCIAEALPGTDTTVSKLCRMPIHNTQKLLRALGELGIVDCMSTGEWQLTEKGQFLKRDHQLTLAEAALEYAGALQTPWKDLHHVLINNDNSSGEIFKEIANDSTRKYTHHRMLRSYAEHDYRKLIPLLPIKPGDSVLDAGGGDGVFAEMILGYYRDVNVHVHVLDLPGIIEMMPKNITSTGCDLFQKWPAQGDVVILARVLHDWNDEKALQILRNAHHALNFEGRLILLEMLLHEENYYGSLCNLHLYAVTGGKERSEGQYKELLRQAGFSSIIIMEQNVPALIIGDKI